MRSTDYSIDVFKKILSSFCLITYNEPKTEFSETDVLETLTKVAQLDGIQVKAQPFWMTSERCLYFAERWIKNKF